MHVPKFGRAANSLCCLLAILGSLLVGCAPVAPGVVKIGLVAPFEGRYREIGVDVITAARLAIREWAEGHPSSSIAIELVAYDDAGQPQEAVEQAQKLAVDSDVEIVIGHWLDDTTEAALPVYQETGLPLVTFCDRDLKSTAGIYNLSPADDAIIHAGQAWSTHQDSRVTLALHGDLLTSVEIVMAADVDDALVLGGSLWGLDQFYRLSENAAEGTYFMTGFSEVRDVSGAFWTDEHRSWFSEAYQAGSLGAPPGLYAAAAYEATWVAIHYLATQHHIDSGSTPADPIAFASSGRRTDAPIYLYRWDNGRRTLIDIVVK